MIYLIAAIIISMFFISSCTVTPEPRLYDSVKTGFTFDQVIQVLGQPNDQQGESLIYVEPFYLAVVPLHNGKVADKISFKNYERNYEGSEYSH